MRAGAEIDRRARERAADRERLAEAAERCSPAPVRSAPDSDRYAAGCWVAIALAIDMASMKPTSVMTNAVDSSVVNVSQSTAAVQRRKARGIRPTTSPPPASRSLLPATCSIRQRRPSESRRPALCRRDTGAARAIGADRARTRNVRSARMRSRFSRSTSRDSSRSTSIS